MLGDDGERAVEDVTVDQPVKLSRTPSRMDNAGPGHGEHTEEVLGEFGFTRREIDALRAEGVITPR